MREGVWSHKIVIPSITRQKNKMLSSKSQTNIAESGADAKVVMFASMKAKCEGHDVRIS
jgi:hypothetical protein